MFQGLEFRVYGVRGTFHLIPSMLNKWEGSLFLVWFSISFHLKVFKSSISFGSVKWFEFFLGFGESNFLIFFKGSFHLPSMEFILTHLDLSSFNSNKELLEEIAVNDQITMQATIACVNIWEYFTSIELDEESEKSFNLYVNVWDILTIMWTTPSLFKFLSNFILGKFEKLAQLVILTSVGRFSWVAWKLARFSS